MGRDRTRIWVSKEFEKTAREKYPYKSMYKITKELNKIILESMYGVKTDERKKRKHN